MSTRVHLWTFGFWLDRLYKLLHEKESQAKNYSSCCNHSCIASCGNKHNAIIHVLKTIIMTLDTSVSLLPRTSAKTIAALKRNGLETYEDLVYYAPIRYEDYSNIKSISDLQKDELVTVKGTIVEGKNNYVRKGLNIQKVVIEDETGIVEVVWYNQPYLIKQLVPGRLISVSGNVGQFRNLYNIQAQEHELIQNYDTHLVHTGRIVPYYSAVRGISTRTLRDKIQYVLEQIKDEQISYLPKKITNIDQSLSQTLFQLHFPTSFDELSKSKEHLGFIELFIKLLSSRLVKEEWKKQQTNVSVEIQESIVDDIEEFVKKLPFTLTRAQKKAIEDIKEDLQQKYPMNRFLQGDVGSGKTVVAAAAAYGVAKQGYSVLIMAPTEVLAEQHFDTFQKVLSWTSLKIGLQTGSRKMLMKGEQFDIVIGTHALFTKGLDYENVGLVVIDEQHRFGVRQRGMLKKKGSSPNVLTMTATPIPRTVTLTLYSELEQSVLDEMPKNRKEIKTHLVPQGKRNSAYTWIKKQIDTEKIQVYIICPLVETSEKETMSSIRAATDEYNTLKTIFKNYTLALLHGKLKSSEKTAVMSRFGKGEIDILISTSVVEVGVDVPNATIMIIEGAERFGMAQLHQLRGRVGRGKKQSYCLLFTSENSKSETEKLTFFAGTNSGLQIAEYDFKKRGPGEIHGLRQHGYSDLQFANLSNLRFVQKVKSAVEKFDKDYSLDDYPEIKNKLEQENVKFIARD